MLKTLFGGASALDHTNDADWTGVSFVDRIKAAFSARTTAAEADEVGAFIEAHGGVLTDNLEREISRRFGHMAGGPRS